MSVNIVAVTRPTSGLDIDDFIAYVARVSNPSNQNNTETSGRLIKYLVKNKHWSPFELVHVVMEIETTRDIARQILRHRSFTFQEFSQRYADPTKDLGFTTREARLQDSKNRQNSTEIMDDADYQGPNGSIFGSALKNAWNMEQDNVRRAAEQAYKWAIDNGIAKEQARAVLPEGLTVSRMYMSGSLRSWIHYCQLRCDNGTQKEHREIAIDCWYKIMELFPSLKELDLIDK
jgi:thymidylate synthase (FAD)